jgi:GTP cyclohydrolase II
MRSLADPAADFSRAPLGPLTPCEIVDLQAAAAAIVLCRLAGLLPAVWVSDADTGVSIKPSTVLAAERRSEVTLAARARLPIEGLEAEAQVAVFRADADGSEHVAVIVGAPGGRPPLVRLHSECLTGDVFGSLKCDCGPQLRQALKLIAAEGAGVLLYLRDEGRGIGLANKTRAYQLQDRGLDTVDANRRLGFADDERDYSLAAAMLTALGLIEVRLLTNNPGKVSGLERAGISVVERVPHHMPANPHNADYLAVKRTRSGHLP